MSTPRFLVENFFDPTQFSGHVVSANEEESGHEAFRVGTNRRSRRNYWTPTTTNSVAWIKVDATESKTADMIAIDRRNNLAGETVALQTSSNDSDWSDVFSITFPSSFSEPNDLTASPGVLMEDDAWAFYFGDTSARYWRVHVSAMGADLKPEIGGIYLGGSWQPDLHLARPFDWGRPRIEFQTSRSETAWVSASQVSRRLETEMSFKLKSHAEYDDFARYHIEQLFLSKTPMWVFPDTDRGERGWLAVPKTGVGGFQERDGWGFPQATIPAVEHEPEPA